MYRITEENIVCCICVLMACRLVTSSITSRDYNVILVKSQSSKMSHSEIRTRIDYPYGQTRLSVSVTEVLKMPLNPNHPSIQKKCYQKPQTCFTNSS